MSRSKAKIPETARSHRARDLAQSKQFRSVKLDPLSEYSRHYLGKSWGAGAVSQFSSRWRVRPNLPLNLKLPALSFRRAIACALSIAMLGKAVVPSWAEAITRPLINYAVAATEPVFHLRSRAERIGRGWSCSRQRLILDINDQPVGIAPVNPCPDSDRPDYRSTGVSAPVTRELAEAIVALEGEYQANAVTFFGLNLQGWVAAAAGIGVAGRGGSSPQETARKNAAGVPGKLGFREKLASGIETIAFTATLATPQDRDAFVIENLPCARGAPDSAFGPPVAGALCFFVLFDAIDLKSTTLMQRCVVAASYRRQVVVAGPETAAEDLTDAKSQNDQVVARARNCIKKIATTPVAMALANAELDTAARRFPLDPTVRKSQSSVDPAEQLKGRLPGAGYLLADHMRIEKAGGQSPLRLTLSTTIQQAMAPEFDAILKSLGPRVPDLCTTACKDPDKQIDMAVTIGELKDDRIDIVASMATKFGLFDGRLRRAGDSYEPMVPNRAVGSLNKSWLAPLLTRASISTLCNAFYKGVRNPGKAGDTGVADCSLKEAMIPVPFAYAHSENLPFLSFANQFGGSNLRHYAEQLGLSPIENLSDDDLPAGFVLGHAVVATPATMMRNLAALYRGGVAGKPLASMPTAFQAAEPRSPIDLGVIGFDLKMLKAATELLRAPIYHPTGGTLSRLGPVLARLGCDQAIGKTGTPESVTADGDKANRDKLVLAAFRCGQRRFVAFGMIGSPNIAVSVGSVASADVVRLVEAALSATLKAPGVRHASRF